MNATTIRTLDQDRASIVGFDPAVPAVAGYRARRGPNWIVVTLIAALHLVALWALVTLDVIRVRRVAPEPLVMTLIPESAPPPPATPPPAPAPAKPVTNAVPVPVPEVRVAAAPAPIAVTTVTPPPAPVASAPPAAPVAVPSPAAAPITPPSASAATLNNPAPRYPIDARRKREEGTVRLRVVITVDGRVKEIAVAKSSGFDSLDEAALAAVKRWRFVPGMQAGQPVEATGFVPIPFRLTA